MHSKGRRGRKVGTVLAVYGTPEKFSMTGCRDDGGQLGKGVGAKTADFNF